MIWEWSEMGNRSALDIAHAAQCKKFVCHAHVQSLLDDVLLFSYYYYYFCLHFTNFLNLDFLFGYLWKTRAHYTDLSDMGCHCYAPIYFPHL